MPVLPSWLNEPLRNQFIALLPERSAYAPTHPLGCRRPRISDRVVFDKMPQLPRFGCSYQAIADTSSAATIRNRRAEWIRLGAGGERVEQDLPQLAALHLRTSQALLVGLSRPSPE